MPTHQTLDITNIIIGSAISALIGFLLGAIFEHRVRIMFAVNRFIASRRKKGASVTIGYRFKVPAVAEFKEWIREEYQNCEGYEILSSTDHGIIYRNNGYVTSIRQDLIHEELTIELQQYQNYWKQIPADVAQHASKLGKMLEKHHCSPHPTAATVQVQSNFLMDTPTPKLKQLEVQGIQVELQHSQTSTIVNVDSNSAQFASNDKGVIVAILQALL